MNNPKNFQEFLDENIPLVKDYVETRSTIYRLKAIRTLSNVFGLLIWLMISAFLFFLVLIFVGLVMGFWFAEMTGSLASGFGIATLLLMTFIVVLALLRKQIFIYPLIRIFIQTMTSDDQSETKSEEHGEN
jgi:hypothetical protein